LGWGSLAMAGSDDSADRSEPKPAAQKSSWFGWMLGGSTPAKPAEAPPREAPIKKTKPAPVKPTPVVDEAAAVRSREETAYLRRVAVCDRLKQVALQNNDQELVKMAEQLEERAWVVYSQRTAQLPASHADFDLDERILEQHDRLSTAAAAAPPVSPTHTVPGQTATSSRRPGREE
jgi:hypothetical protein